METNKANTKLMPGCVIYTRVSSEEQTSNYSLDSQEDYCRKETQRLGLEVLTVFREEGASASNLNRPELVKLIAYCQKNKNKIVSLLLYRFDRISRNTLDFLVFKKKLLSFGIKLVSVTEPSEDSATGEFVSTLLAAIATLDNQVKSERTKAGLLARYNDGWFSGKPPLGYKSIEKDGKKIVIPDPETFKKVEECWVKMTTGTTSLIQITKIMNEMGLRSYWKKRSWPIRPQTANRIFRDKFYAGWLQSKIYKMEIRGKHIPMVTEEQFYQVQNILTGRKTNLNLHRVRDNQDFDLRGLVVCTCTHKLLSAWCKGRTKKYATYWCANKDCPVKSISASKLQNQLVANLRAVQPSERTVEMFLTILKRKYQKRLFTLKNRQKQSEQLITSIKESRKELAYKNLHGVYSDSVHKEIDFELENRLLGANVVKNEDLIDKYNIEGLLAFAKRLLSDLGQAYLVGGLYQRRTLIGSIYTSGIVFSEKGLLNQGFSPLFQAILDTNPHEIQNGWLRGLEPPTSGSTSQRSNQLSYSHHLISFDVNSQVE